MKWNWRSAGIAHGLDKQDGQHHHDPVSGEKQLIMPRSEQLVKQFEFRLGHFDNYPTMKELKDFRNDLEELLPFKRFQDHFVNLLKQSLPSQGLDCNEWW
jgi:hypothetical protein